MSDTILVALIMSIAPTLAVIVSWLKSKRKLGEIHDVVNGNHERALAEMRNAQKLIGTLLEEIGRLKTKGE